MQLGEINIDVNAILAQLAQAMQKYGPSAYDTAASVVQVGAIGDLLRAGFALILGLAFLFTALHMNFLYNRQIARYATLKKACWGSPTPAQREEYDSMSDPEDDNGLVVPGVFLCVLGCGFVTGSYGLFNTWAWAGAFNPKLALAHSILQTVIHGS